MKRVSFFTLGCKLNQSETASLADGFRRRGYTIVPFGERSDISVINTCTVTAKSDYRCRQNIRKAIKQSPDAVIAVVGCYAQTDANAILEIPGVDIVLGSDRKFEIFDYLDSDKLIYLHGENQDYVISDAGTMDNQTRAFLKIQDGCDSYCSYCIVPYARGKSRSAESSGIIQQVNNLVAENYREIVLTGVHIGKYGMDIPEPSSLTLLLRRMLHETQIERIRLSSLEPTEITAELIALVAESDRICNHFHIPLQSGDNDVLRAMNRHYTREHFRETMVSITEQIARAGIGTDVIVGFPGETDEQFSNTYALIDELSFSYLHVFSYSPRPGTVAAERKDSVPDSVKKERSAVLIELGKTKKASFYKNAAGQTAPVLYETKSEKNQLWMYGFTDNYIRIRSKNNPQYYNKIINTVLSEYDPPYIHGEIEIEK
ncbi:tRNA (N(6)-L-threonylcarbamoyladenosine(37)-C(2))-methylthiotransferase MtaB [candidate division KSB1 bacterium]|nr:tRNA (N(6)-L-threonylcarbamoyladenosine(37)-C(2))-methylthiotransferase MtaB [candidate division KSB1 bacterium]